MLFALFFIVFRVIPPRNGHKYNKLEDECPDIPKNDVRLKDYIDTYIKQSNCNFVMDGINFLLVKTKEGSDLINLKDCTTKILRCTFGNCIFGQALINCNQSNTKEITATFDHNTISNSVNYDGADGEPNIFSIKAKNCSITSNKISFQSTDKACRAFYIGKCDMFMFSGNTVERANCKSGKGCVVYIEYYWDILGILVSNFNYCGGGKSSLFFVGLNHDGIKFTYSNFIDCKNENSDPDSSFPLFYFGGDTRNISFIDCYLQNFDSIQNSCISIGTMYASPKIIFTTTSFKSFLSKSEDKSIFRIDDTETVSSTFIFNQCIFRDSELNSGVIYFRSNEGQLTVENCLFSGITISEENKERGIIFIHYQPSGQNILIKGNTFENNICKLGGSIYVLLSSQTQGEFSIDNCTFSGGSAEKIPYFYISGGDGQFSMESISITNCKFIGNKAELGSLLNISDKICNKWSIDSCSFESNQGAIAITSSDCDIDINNVTFSKTEDFPALLVAQSAESTRNINIVGCTFEACKSGSGIKCFDISILTPYFTFSDNIIKSNVGAGAGNKFGLINANNKVEHLTITNITFSENICNSLFGGGSGMSFEGIKKLSFVECKFINNQARQDTSQNRPIPSPAKSYYNGDGGGIQIGYLCPFNNIEVVFSKCQFKGNKAERHGGAIAIQTLQTVEITECEFENNIANYNFEDDANLLFENHFDKKTDGRGGAIYINPTYSYEADGTKCPTSDEIYLKDVNINKCSFTSNKAYDGYAMYIEGDDPGTSFSITNNNFIDNYNESNHKNDVNKMYGAVISSEILTLLKKEIIEDNGNTFDNHDKIVKEILFVDHYGNPIPSDYFSKSDEFSFSDDFTKSSGFTYSSYFSYSSYFTCTSGFTFTSGFTYTSGFTKTTHFTDSTEFSNSLAFTKSSGFTYSSYFSYSSYFTCTSGFTYTSGFTKTTHFTDSVEFTNSGAFTKSDFFPSSNFTMSNYFSDSAVFTQSAHFTDSLAFTNSATPGNANKMFDGVGGPGGKKRRSLATIFTIIFGLLALIILILIIIFLVIRRNKEEPDAEVNTMPETETEPASGDSRQTEFDNPLYENNMEVHDPFDDDDDDYSMVFV